MGPEQSIYALIMVLVMFLKTGIKFLRYLVTIPGFVCGFVCEASCVSSIQTLPSRYLPSTWRSWRG